MNRLTKTDLLSCIEALEETITMVNKGEIKTESGYNEKEFKHLIEKLKKEVSLRK